MKKIFLSIAITMFLCSLAVAQNTEDIKYAKSIERLQKAQNSEKMFEVAFDQMFNVIAKDLDESLLPGLMNFKNEMKAKAIADLIPMLVPIYKKYWSLADVEELIVFYESPIGKKVSETQPLIMGESMAVGQEWGRKVGKEIFEKIQEVTKD